MESGVWNILVLICKELLSSEISHWQLERFDSLQGIEGKGNRTTENKLKTTNCLTYLGGDRDLNKNNGDKNKGEWSDITKWQLTVHGAQLYQEIVEERASIKRCPNFEMIFSRTEIEKWEESGLKRWWWLLKMFHFITKNYLFKRFNQMQFLVRQVWTYKEALERGQRLGIPYECVRDEVVRADSTSERQQKEGAGIQRT